MDVSLSIPCVKVPYTFALTHFSLEVVLRVSKENKDLFLIQPHNVSRDGFGVIQVFLKSRDSLRL